MAKKTWPNLNSEIMARGLVIEAAQDFSEVHKLIGVTEQDNYQVRDRLNILLENHDQWVFYPHDKTPIDVKDEME